MSISATETEREALLKLWPIGKFPVLRDDARDRTVPESSVIIEYLDRHYPGTTQLHPRGCRPGVADAGCRTASTISMCTSRCRRSSATGCVPAATSAMPHGVEEAKARLKTSYGMIDREMATRTWAIGEAFSLADCAAAPALFYANEVMPFGAAHRQSRPISIA